MVGGGTPRYRSNLPKILYFFYMHNIGFPFKGIVSRDEYFIEGPKNQISTLCMSADGFHNIVFLLWNQLQILKQPSSTLLRSSFRIPCSSRVLWFQKLFRMSPVTLEIVKKAGYGVYSKENLPMTAKKSRNRNSEASFGTVLKNLTTFCVCTEVLI